MNHRKIIEKQLEDESWLVRQVAKVILDLVFKHCSFDKMPAEEFQKVPEIVRNEARDWAVKVQQNALHGKGTTPDSPQ
jgi:hypothetical protein